MARPDNVEWKKTATIFLALLLIGGAFITIGQMVVSGVALLGHVLIHIGTAFIVAGVVSAIFDIWYHKHVFGDPVQSINKAVQTAFEHLRQFNEQVTDIKANINTTQSELKSLHQSVHTFAQILKATNESGVVAISRRVTDDEKRDWHSQVRMSIDSAERFVFLFGRTFFELLPYGRPERGIRDLLTDKARSMLIVVLLPDTYNVQGEYRREICSSVQGDVAELYRRPRVALQEFLKIAEEAANSKVNIAIKLLTRTSPFALIMTEREAIIEPYLPYCPSGNSLIMQVRSDAKLYSAYKDSFIHLYREGRHVDEVLSEYCSRKSSAADRHESRRQIAAMIRGFSENPFVNIAP